VWFWDGPIWRIPHGNHVEIHDSFGQLVIGNSYTISLLVFLGGMIIMLALRRSAAIPSSGHSIDRAPWGIPGH
jgi:hypothetical protein